MFFILLIIGLATFVWLSVKFYMAARAGRFETSTADDSILAGIQSSKQWWAKRRLNYNKGLLISGVIAFLTYAILGGLLIAPHDSSFEVTLFTTIFQGLGYLVMMLVANIFYNLGQFVDTNFNDQDSDAFRKRLYHLGFWFSVALPFLIPALIVFEYFGRHAGF